MRKNSLTTAIVACIAGIAGFAGLANAVHLNPDGLGQVLLYPYYTVNDNQPTALSVVNHSDVAKAVKVRFLEGYNTRDVVDFNLFLSPYDVWTATIFSLGDSGVSHAAIFTADSVHQGYARVADDQSSEWVTTYPTRQFVVDPPPTLMVSAGMYVDDVTGIVAVHLPGFYLDVTEPSTVGVAPG